MQFQVPQFIEVEDKIFGPLTFRQFVYLAGGAGLCYILWRVFPVYIALPLIAGFGGFGVALAFFQYNGQPFILAIEHGFYFYLRSKLYLWSNEKAIEHMKEVSITQAAVPVAKSPFVPKLSDSRLHDLAWSLDINERISAGVATEDDRNSRGSMQDIVAPVKTAREALVR